jgi:nucleotide-binding universal stress UspA family protein
MYQRILIPTDGSACADEAVAEGLRLAQALEATVVFLFVMNTVPVIREGVVNFEEALEILRPQGRAVMARALGAADAARIHAEGVLLEGVPSDVIVRESAAFDLLVMGSRGAGVVRRVILGSVTESVLRHVRRPMLVVPARSVEVH